MKERRLEAETRDGVELSVVIPVFNEEENIPILFPRLKAVLDADGNSYEVIFVDDGSTDASLQRMLELKAKHPRVRIVHFRANRGKSAALSAGFDHAAGKNIITMDADYQESPEDIPLLRKTLESGFDMVSGWRHERRDPPVKVLASAAFNWFVRRATRTGWRDVNCGFKIYRREVVGKLRLYGELHRVIPVLAQRQGFRVGEARVAHQPREHGVSKFGGIRRGIHGVFDLATVLFLSSYQKRPLHFFGMAGAVLFVLGLGVNLFLTLRYFFGAGYIGERMPLLMLGILSMILGFQSFCLGLVGEMVARRDTEERRDKDEEWLP
jgi:glycosyltransferase involved in cell wall biosynthesis